MFRKQIHSSKWANKTETQAYPLTLADMDFPLYEPFKQKLVQSISNLNNLTYKDRSSQYFNALKQWYSKNHQAELKQQYFVQSPSICNLIACCILAFTNQQQKVLVFTPVYSFYMKSIKTLNRKVVACQFKECPVKNQDNSHSNIYQYDFDIKQFEIIMDRQKPQLIILCHPHNPTGKIFAKQQLDFIVKKTHQYNSYILSDEIMGDFSLFHSQNIKPNKKFISLSTYNYDKIIVGNSISKVFNCESVQGGYGIIRCQNTRKKYQKIASAVKLLTNQMSLILTPIVYSKNGERWITQINDVIHKNFTLFKQTFASSKSIKIFYIKSSYLTTIEFNYPEKEALARSNKNITTILASFKIYFIDMQEYFYPQTNKNIFRISIAIDPDEFRKFVTKFKKCVEEMEKTFLQKNTGQDLSEIRKSKL